MKVLFVNCCVREESRTLFLCRKYLEMKYSTAEISEIILEKEGLMPFNNEMLTARDKDTALCDFSSAKYKYAREFATADVIIIAAPYWDCSFPSMLKVYFEHICVNGITFCYDKGVPKKLCNANELTYITTAGGYLPDNSSVEGYIRELCQLLCIDEVKFHCAQGLDVYGNSPQKILLETVKGF